MASKKRSLGSNIFLLGVLVIALGSISLTLSTIKSQNPDSEAARGGNSGGGGKPAASITLNQPEPHLGDSITFTTSASGSITINCFQGGLGNLVYAARQATGTSFVLGGGTSQWQSGEATCIAYLFNKDKLLTSTSFNALGAR